MRIINYTTRLGVLTKLLLASGAYHGVDILVPDAAVSKTFIFI